MPGLVGGFGKINISMNIIKKHFSTNKELETQIELRSKIGPYLAGLIESDGTIAVHNKDSNTKKYNPKIAVVFNLVDEPLAKKLASITNAGTIYKKQNAGHVLWQIQKLEDVIKIINIINGFLRTGKIVEFHRAIQWCNDNLYTNIKPLPLNNSRICSDGWLAGFVNKNSSFSITVSDRSRVISELKIKVNVII